MESIVFFVMSNGTTVITVLLGAIILCVFSLLIIGFHSPIQAVASEIGTVDRLEGALKRIPSEQDWPKVGFGGGDGEHASLLASQIENLEVEVKEKQKEIEALKGGGGGDLNEAVKVQIKDLEERLAEYEVIEDDIADLSKFRAENMELKKRIAEATGIEEEETASMPWDEFEQIVKSKKTESVKDSVVSTVTNND